ncbi:hypothetical protein VM1G_02568 [Cytospora mali]|uniref:Major facilitator superfamily (MFS) profile domain-containing protein n=1 Tax=Cytospora mali TaxID=578113 RepID=A0A194VUM7_CYTMA|nr:hypothetical protein VM1G_02568 [Valsa mali]
MATATTDPPPRGRDVHEAATSTSGSEKAVRDEKTQTPSSEKRELTAAECEGELGFDFPRWKKWWILTVIFIVQLSMNFNASLYSNGQDGISEQFGVNGQSARLGAGLFLIFYAFGCELWAPWSEELGRKPILQASLFLVNIWNLPVVLAPNFASLVIGRCLGGLSSAGGSVTLGMIADMFDSDNQQYAVAYIVFSSVGGAILGPIVGGFVQQFLDWKWCIWIQLIFGAAVQILHLLTVPETRTTIMINNIAKKRRKNGEDVWGPDEIQPFRERFTWNELFHTWYRPFRMFVTEPIVLVLSLLSGFSDALIFIMIQSFGLVYKQWGFNAWQIGLTFVPIGIGYFIAWASFVPAIKRNEAQRRNKPESEHAQYESRLWWLLFLAPCLPLGLFIFAFTCNGPPIHWIGTMFATAIIGIANYAIYMATIDYMICAYGPYSASATGGNGWARDFLAGVLTFAATPFLENIPGQNGKPFFNAIIILFCVSFLLVIAVYVIYWKGPALRKRSPFAESLAHGLDTEHQRPVAPVVHTPADGAQTPVTPGVHRAQRPHFGPGSRTSSYTVAREMASRNASRNASRAASRAPSRAQSFEEGRDGGAGTHDGEQTPKGSKGAVHRAQRPTFGAGSRTSSYTAAREVASRNASRTASRVQSRAPSFDEERDGEENPYFSASGPKTPGQGAKTPGTPGHAHAHQLHNRLAPLAKIDSEHQ